MDFEGRPPRLYAGPVGHDGHPVKGWLPVEQNHITIPQVPLHSVAYLKVSSKPPPVSKLQESAPSALVVDEIGTRPSGHACKDTCINCLWLNTERSSKRHTFISMLGGVCQVSEAGSGPGRSRLQACNRQWLGVNREPFPWPLLIVMVVES